MSWIVIAVSASVTLAVTPLARRLALAWGWVDRPAEHKFHRRPTPLLGGLALFLGTMPPLVLAGEGTARWTFAAGASLLFATGLWDDRRHLSVPVKLAAQAAAATVLVGGGARAELPGPAWLATVLSLVWIVGVTNAVNLLDSMDGAAPGVALAAAAGFLLLAGGPPPGGSPPGGAPLSAVLAPALAGALLGFLPYNLPPARIFMGDAGSLPLGFSLAALGLEARVDGVAPSVAWMVPVALLAVPIFDTTLVCGSRLRRGKNPMTHPGKDHFAHRLARRGLGVRGALAWLYALGALSVVLAWALSRSGPVLAGCLAGAVALAAGLGLAWLDRPEPRFRPAHSAGRPDPRWRRSASKSSRPASSRP
jgi:UDP-GlcNAc:undecaprenyl-phosphate GlcNAc-1-phosphate transferase